MALDLVELMTGLGHETFHLVGHDRSARVRTLTVLDISPTLKMFEITNLAFAPAHYHWFLMLQRLCRRNCSRAMFPSTFSGGLGARSRT